MKIVAIIPSRFGSTRFEGKPLAAIAGKPMIQRVYESVAGAQRVEQVIVATDDNRIRDAVDRFGGLTVMTSPDNRSGTDRVAEAAQILDLQLDDIIINVQGDQPLVNPLCLNAVVEPLLTEPEVDMSTLACRIVDDRDYANPKDCKVVVDHRGFALYFSRAPIPYVRDAGDCHQGLKHLGVYAYRRRFLELFRYLPLGECEKVEKLEQLRALEFGYRIKVVMSEFNSPEVDLPEDIANIERILRERPEG